MNRIAARGSVAGDPDATRRDILQAAKRLIAIQGFHATTVRQIARKVSMKGGSLYYHFANKDEILFALFDEGNRRLLEAAHRVLALGLNGAPRILRKLIQEHMCVLAGDQAQFMVVTRELHQLKGARRERIMAQRDEYDRIVRGVIEQGIKEGSFKPCNAKIVSYGLIAWLNGVAYWFSPSGSLTIEHIASEYSRVLFTGLQK